MRKVRIALADVPDELRHLVEEGLADQPDLSLVVAAQGEVALLLQAARVDVVVVAMARGEVPAVAERLLDEYPRIGVVCIDLAEGRGVVYRLRPNQASIDEVSPQAIATAIRGATEDIAAWG